MSFNRRQFIQVSGLTLCAVAIPGKAEAAEGEIPLPVPPLLESKHGQPLFLTLHRNQWSFYGDNRKALVWGINGFSPGPTIRVRKGDNVKLVYTNRLSESVSMTVSGLQVDGALKGGARRVIEPGVSWSPVLPVHQSATTLWYHANTPGKMAAHVYHGLAGMWLIEDEVSRALTLPSHYGVDDFPIIIQDKRLDGFGAPVYEPLSDEGFMGDTLIVNGVINPYVNVSRGWIRLRLVNASNARCYTLTLSDQRDFRVITSDQGFLPTPVVVKQLSLAPGERREVLLDMSEGKEVALLAGEAATFMERLRGLFEPSTQLISNQILILRPEGLLPLVTDSLPLHLLQEPIETETPVQTRELKLSTSPPGINGVSWEPARIDIRATEGSCERWLISTETPQALHIEGCRFLIKSVNGGQPTKEDSGWKDTVWIESQIELLVMFMRPSSEQFPFVYFSQNLELADAGCAGQLEVVPASLNR